jgi:NAD(P)-dependent dehydrogenase (short-subunit alcohol dehydrogenase family)
MAKIFITGSTDGLGLLAAKSLIDQGHDVYLHARSKARKEDVINNVTEAKGVFVADLLDIEQIKQLAKDVNESGNFDVIIHNAGVYTAPGKDIFTVNVIAPYILSCLIEKPKRLVYIGSDMHLGGHFKLSEIHSNINGINYSDSKLHILMLCKAFARLWPDVCINAIHPGWVPTKMGGKGAPDDLQKGSETQVWLSTSHDKEALVTGKYFFHKKQSRYNPEADELISQDQLLRLCGEISGVKYER